MVPCEHGKCAVWDFTCSDTLAPSYRAVVVSAPGSAQAEIRKIAKYSPLNSVLCQQQLNHWAHLGRGLLNSAETCARGLHYKVVIHQPPPISFNALLSPSREGMQHQLLGQWAGQWTFFFVFFAPLLVSALCTMFLNLFNVIFHQQLCAELTQLQDAYGTNASVVVQHH